MDIPQFTNIIYDFFRGKHARQQPNRDEQYTRSACYGGFNMQSVYRLEIKEDLILKVSNYLIPPLYLKFHFDFLFALLKLIEIITIYAFQDQREV